MFVMEKKKNKKANLENFRRLFLLIGLFVSIGIVGSLFSWKSTNDAVSDIGSLDFSAEDELVQITVKDKKVEKVIIEPLKQPQAEIIQLVKDDEIVDDVFFVDDEIGEDDPVDIIEIDEGPDEVVTDIPFIKAEKDPVYPGGLLALRRDIYNNVNYPAVARENDIQGTVYLRFVVTKTGKIGKIELQRGVDKLLDDEAIRVIKKLKKFKPGQQGGKNVSVWYSLPIVYKLSD